MNKIETKSRIGRFFELNPQPPLNSRALRNVHWARTDSLTLAELFWQYVEKGVTHSHHLADLLAQSARARELVSTAQSVVVIGPGFGEEIDQLEGLYEGPVWAAEINKNAWPVLGFEREGLRIVDSVDALPSLSGPVAFVGVHVLRQPSLATDAAMRAFAAELLRAAPGGFSLLSTLPNCYTVPSKFAKTTSSFFECGVDCDELLVESLRELGAAVTISMGISNCTPRARLALIEVAP
jgi:hypothetical protein